MPDRFKDARDLIKRGYYRGTPKEFYQKFIDRVNPMLEEARVTKKQIDGLKPKVDALESQISELKNKISALKTQYKSKQRAISKPRLSPQLHKSGNSRRSVFVKVVVDLFLGIIEGLTVPNHHVSHSLV